MELRGYLAWDGGREGPRPGVLVVHEWWGHDDYVRGRARQLAERGYVAYAVDMYGAGKRAETPQEAQALMGQVLGNPQAMRRRFEASRAALAARPGVDARRMAAIGYCFGGSVVLEMARQGLELAAVAAFHPGGLSAEPAVRGTYRAKTLVCLGADDPFVPAEQRRAFQKALEAAGAELDLVEYPGVVHGFSVPAATKRGKEHGLPLAYDARADRDSWERLERLLAGAFGP